MKTEISFVVPAKDEAESIVDLYLGIVKNTEPLTHDFEIVFVDDGSTDSTFVVLKNLKKKDNRIKIIRHRGNWGKSASLMNGFARALGQTIITMDADLQDDPSEIPNFAKKINEGYDLVSGWKKKRHDPPSKTIPSKLGNFLTRILTGAKVHDLNCGYKAYRRRVVENLNLYGELYKFIPILAAKENFKITEIPVSHHPRKYGKSKYGWERNIKGILDLITVVFLAGYVRRPGHFFGGIGLLSLLVGVVIGMYITYLRVTTGSIQYRHPLLFLGILLMVIGVQLVTTGLLAEMIIYQGKRFDYKSSIEEVL